MFNIKATKLASTLFGLTVVLLTSCKIAPPTSSDYDANFDFTKLKTYSWVEPKEEDKNKVSTLESRRQISAIEVALKQKGFEKNVTDGKTADFLLRTHTLTDKKQDTDAFYGSWGYYPYGYHGYSIHHSAFGYGGGGYRREYEIGTLVLDVIDPDKKEVIWRGSVSRKLGVYKNRTPEERTSITMKNATYLLENFPPKP